ncbi:MAG: tRNA 2-thiouridine(34) synthase MnmA [Neisseriaceae bacterium]
MSEIVVGMSGGVDSSVAAYLLKQEGHKVRGIFMQNWEEEDSSHCSIKADSLDAISVADILGIDVDLVNFAKEYQERVFRFFLDELREGRTPNPDVLCNSEIKFKAFLDYAREQGAEQIATGHYARKHIRDGVSHLLKAKDLNKDQSYFLYRLCSEQLAATTFPLGGLTKPQVRRIASQLGLPVANKKDSTGICFVGERQFRSFLQQYLPLERGLILTPEGREVGEHIGLAFYTIGQRKGLGIGGNGKPWYVAEKDKTNNTLVVVQGHDHPLLFCREILVKDLSFISGSAPKEECYEVKIRYRMKEERARLSYVSDEAIRLVFERPVWAATKGQSAVIYRGEVCLGGGLIVATKSA